MTEKTATVTKPLFATVGAGDAIYAAVNDVVADVRGRVVATDAKTRVEEARERIANVPADVQAQFDTLRDRISGLPSELPEDLAELREKFTPKSCASWPSSTTARRSTSTPISPFAARRPSTDCVPTRPSTSRSVGSRPSTRMRRLAPRTP